MANRGDQLISELDRRILILDGAMGTMLQKCAFSEADFRGGIFADHPVALKGDNDVLNLTQPQAVLNVHAAYLEAGADIIETNTFNANAMSQKDYALSDRVYELNRAGAAVARSAADAFTERTPGKPRFVAGSVGPTGKTLSMSPSVADPSLRDLTFAELENAYREAAAGLLDGGADILLLETIFDTLNAKAAIRAFGALFRERDESVPVMISGTVSDASGRLLAGQDPDAFLISVAHAPRLLSVGFNCALGAEEMRPHIAALAAHSPFFVSAHPNAGLPDEFGRYRQSPEQMAEILKSFAADGLLNIAGGCCGTTPAHIRAIADALDGMAPRKRPVISHALRLAGLDPLEGGGAVPFLNVGERTNVAGSKKFLKTIREGRTDDAVRIARQQVENGAAIVDVNMDDAILDGVKEMRHFLLRLAAEPDIARVPVMIDSSDFNVIAAGLECVQGKCVVNSISLKDGEEKFLARAAAARSFGAALLCMAFDEKGQADTVEKRVSVCRRMYRLLTEKLAVPPDDIIFDVNVFAVATGMPEHDSYAKDFIEAVRLLKKEFPFCHFSGGISNVSFSFRGSETVRAALHSVFLFHATAAGLDMGIVNPAQLAQYDELDPRLRTAAEAVILNTSPDAAEQLLAIASGLEETRASSGSSVPEWRTGTLEQRIQFALVSGDDGFLAADMDEALSVYSDPVKIIEGPLMDAMKEVGVRFGAGKMFLPQVVKTARVMKTSVDFLMPAIQAKQAAGPDDAAESVRHPTAVIATVKGDVHDIGKNIVGVVLKCNGFRVIDLGVMTPCAKIVDTALAESADLVCLSGLITPSLEEMGLVLDELERRACRIPVMVGGAAASDLHTALKLQPRYSGPVAYTSDASQAVPVALALASDEKRPAFVRSLLEQYDALRREADTRAAPVLSFAEACASARADAVSKAAPAPRKSGLLTFRSEPEFIYPFLNWQGLLDSWDLRASKAALPAAADLLADAKKMLALARREHWFQFRSVIGFFPAARSGNDIVLFTGEDRGSVLATLPMLRRQTLLSAREKPLSLADFVAPENDHIGLFALSAGFGVAERAESFRKNGDDYSALLLQTLAGRLAEAYAEFGHLDIRTDLWGYAPGESLPLPKLFDARYRGIRPAIGYPACPDHTLKADLFRILDVTEKIGVRLTENYMMEPAASACGLLFAGENAKYFSVGPVADDQLEDYARRRGMSVEQIRKFIS